MSHSTSLQANNPINSRDDSYYISVLVLEVSKVKIPHCSTNVNNKNVLFDLATITSQIMFRNQTKEVQRNHRKYLISFTIRNGNKLGQSLICIINIKACWKRIQVTNIAVDGFKSLHRKTNAPTHTQISGVFPLSHTASPNLERVGLYTLQSRPRKLSCCECF